MAKIFFSGGGDEKQSFELDSLFANNLQFRKKVLYIPVAMETKKKSYNDCLSWITLALRAHGIKDITMCTNLNDLTLAEIMNYSAIYIGGGNTFLLMKQVKESGFDKLLSKYSENPDKVIYGGSAGAIILGSSIKLAQYFDEQKEDVDLKGLCFYDRLIFPHYKEEHHKKLAKEFSINSIVALSEDSGLIIEKNLVHPVGDGVFFFN